MRVSCQLAAAACFTLAAGAKCSTKCKATKQWSGWEKVKYAFTFGDSYSQTGFETTLEQPSPSNPMGNPAFPGYTSANGPNWVDFLTYNYNASLLQTYNLAFGGATVDSDLVTPWRPDVISLKGQVEDEFLKNYAPGAKDSDKTFWSSDDTFFGIWIGINDVGNTFSSGKDEYTSLYDEIFDVYSGLVDKLYDAGARNFAFLTVPPVDRSPLTIGNGPEAQEKEREAIVYFNGLIEKMAAELKEAKKSVNVWVFDTVKIFDDVLDEPGTYEQTADYKNVDAYCTAYENGTPEMDTLVESCEFPVNEYFWLNSLHPTYPIHDVIAEKLAEALEGSPNVC